MFTRLPYRLPLPVTPTMNLNRPSAPYLPARNETAPTAATPSVPVTPAVPGTPAPLDYSAYETLAQIAALKGISRFVLSPGSRCAPLTLALVQHPGISTRTISDERAAAFMALGMADALQQPVGLLCTSGTAALNYAPALAEAFYRNVPLLVLTADRPLEWLGQNDGQTIPQKNMYAGLVKASFELPVNPALPDEKWHYNRILNEAANLCLTAPFGPVHINVPVREPFYPAPGYTLHFDKPTRLITETGAKPKLDKFTANQLANEWLQTERKLLVAGQLGPDLELSNAVYACRSYNSLPVAADVTANLHKVPHLITHHDLFLQPRFAELHKTLQPQLLVTFGNALLSKNLKVFLRNYRPEQHWHIQAAGPVADTFRSLTRIIRAEPADFLNMLGETGYFTHSGTENAYTQAWQQAEAQAAAYTQAAFEQAGKEGAFTEFSALRQVTAALPDHTALHVSNSMPVRYANYGKPAPERRISVFSNRGTGGIDGCTSTAVGCAWVHKGLTVLITGDMAFFYDRNGLWHNYMPQNLRIVVLNNHGGGIFRIIDGPSQRPELEEYFETKQTQTARRTAADAGMEYTLCSNAQELEAALPGFLSLEGGPKLLETETSSAENAAWFKKFREGLVVNAAKNPATEKE